MNLAHLHLLLNHVPVLGTAFGLVLLVAALLTKNIMLQKVALTVFVVSALFALPVYFSGEPAEEIVEHLPGVAEPLIQQHESAAKLAILAMAALGLVSVIALAMARHRNFSRLVIAACCVATLTFGLMARTANLGGEIRHPEIRSGFAASGVAAQSSESHRDNSRGEHQEKDED
jgi:uncharacterized membrane protein